MQAAERQLAHFTAEHQWRERYVVHQDESGQVVVNGKCCINFCSNDYLQLAEHPLVKKAFHHGVDQYGLGSRASAMVSGYSTAHVALEQAFAKFLKRERAILFNSGYHANIAVLTTFANRHTTVIADKFIHASLIDGIRLAGATLHRYQHGNLAEAEILLKKNAARAPLLISESVFSIGGQRIDIKKMAGLARQFHATLIIDDAHGIGVLGHRGAGIVQHDGLSDNDIPLLITPLGKACASMGAIVSGSHAMIETIVQLARTYRYSTALPPAVCHATLAMLTLIEAESWRREKLQSLIGFFIKEAIARQFLLSSTDATPIKAIHIGDNQLAHALQKKLIDHGFFVGCIRPPTVPAHKACLRISLTCQHQEKEIVSLLQLLCELLPSKKK